MTSMKGSCHMFTAKDLTIEAPKPLDWPVSYLPYHLQIYYPLIRECYDVWGMAHPANQQPSDATNATECLWSVSANVVNRRRSFDIEQDETESHYQCLIDEVQYSSGEADRDQESSRTCVTASICHCYFLHVAVFLLFSPEITKVYFSYWTSKYPQLCLCSSPTFPSKMSFTNSFIRMIVTTKFSKPQLMENK